MGDKSDVLQGTLDLMVLKTLESMGPLHGYGIARRIEPLTAKQRGKTREQDAKTIHGELLAGGCKKAGHSSGSAFPVFDFPFDLLAAGATEGVKLGAPIRFGSAPF